jgi:hypothetical protein
MQVTHENLSKLLVQFYQLKIQPNLEIAYGSTYTYTTQDWM